MRNKSKINSVYIALGVLIVIFFFLDIICGSVNIPIRELISSLFGTESSTPYISDILFKLRLPRAVVALLSGVALSICGLQMQTLFRNPLADPYILGISSGAGLGVGLYVMGGSLLGGALSIGSSGFLGNFGIILAAFAGSLLVTFLILSVSFKLKDNLSLLIFGIMIASVGSAIISLLQYFSSTSSLKTYVLWSMGSFSGLSSSQLIILLIAVLLGMGISLFNIKDLNVLLLGEQYAISLGVNVQRMRRRILIAVSLLTGAVTSFCGPIGFVGIAVPHIARFIFKNADHRVMMPGTALTGAATMLIADLISQLPGMGMTIPINTVSALMGIPVILFIIIRKKEI